MGTDYEKRVLSLMSEHGNSVYYYWNVRENTWWVKSGNFKGLNLESDKYNPLEALLATQQLEGDGRFVFDRYYMRIMGGTVKPIYDDSLSVTFRCKNNSGSGSGILLGTPANDRIYTFTSYFKKNEEGIITEISGFGRQYTDAEVMDNIILSNYTVDNNPALFNSRIEKLLHDALNKKINNTEKNFAFIEFDISNFKHINDKYGTHVGDKVLKYISDMLSILCGNRYLYARMNADIFLVIMPYTKIEEVLDWISILDFNLTWYEGMEYTFAYGINTYTHDEADDDIFGEEIDVRSIIDGASAARKSIKGNEVENIGFFNKELQDEIEYQKSMGAKLRGALENDEFVVYLQPKYDIEKNTIVGAEALLRWNDPVEGIVMPERFIYILEANGLILNVDKFVWEQSCMLIRKWIDEGREVKPISVNVSRKYLNNINIVNYFKELVKKYDIPIELIEIELTETMESGDSNKLIEELRESGFTTLMDDFGSGYSSLGLLRETEFDIIKMDRTFLMEFLDNDKGKTIISHVIAMSKDMGLKIVAEGVETKEQADFLCECGCTTAQGYYYAAPMSVEKFEELLDNEHN